MENNFQSSQQDGEIPAEVDGFVLEALPNMMFRVDIGDGKLLLAYLAGKMRMNRIKVLVGDKVRVKLDMYGERGRIIRRY